MKKFFWLWIPVLLYVWFIFWLSSASRIPPPGLRWHGADKLFHTVEYGILGSLVIRAFVWSWIVVARGRLRLAAIAAALVIGALDEYYQSFTPMRISSVWDWLFDGLGAFLGLALYEWIALRSYRKDKHIY